MRFGCLGAALLAIAVAAPGARADVGFSGESAVATGDEGRYSAVADFNQDGRVDIAAAWCGSLCGGTGNGAVVIATGNGDGTFDAPVTIAGVGVNPENIATGDANEDGDPDLAVFENGTNTVQVFLGGANATFGAPQSFANTSANDIVLAERRDAVVTCKSKRRAGRIKITCTVQLQAAARRLATLSRGHRVYARGRSHGRRGSLRLRPLRAVTPGRYRLRVVVRDARGRRAVLTRRVRIA